MKFSELPEGAIFHFPTNSRSYYKKYGGCVVAIDENGVESRLRYPVYIEVEVVPCYPKETKIETMPAETKTEIAIVCPECKGTGKYVGLFTTENCRTCCR